MAEKPRGRGVTKSRRSGRRRWLLGLAGASLLCAPGPGWPSSWLWHRDAGTDRTRPITRPEAAPGQAKREQALVEAAEESMRGAGKLPRNPARLDPCVDLGMFYLDQHRLDDAANFFARLEGFEEGADYFTLGKLGRAIVLAVQSTRGVEQAVSRSVSAAARRTHGGRANPEGIGPFTVLVRRGRALQQGQRHSGSRVAMAEWLAGPVAAGAGTTVNRLFSPLSRYSRYSGRGVGGEGLGARAQRAHPRPLSRTLDRERSLIPVPTSPSASTGWVAPRSRTWGLWKIADPARHKPQAPAQGCCCPTPRLALGLVKDR